jgi:hypothetical protein
MMPTPDDATPPPASIGLNAASSVRVDMPPLASMGTPKRNQPLSSYGTRTGEVRASSPSPAITMVGRAFAADFR